MRFRIYFIMAMLLGGVSLNAQDIHFSQYYAAPLTLNPSLTGKFNGFYRVTGIYRNQWFGLGGVKNFFSTPSVGVDFSLLKDQIKNGALGVGVVFVNDQQNNKTISANKLLASVAYNMGFGSRQQVQIALGFQGGIAMKQVNKSNLQFAEGFDNTTLTYDPNYNGESINTGNTMREAINMGAFVNMEFIKGMRFYTGYSFGNISRPKDQFISTSSTVNRLPFRHVSHGGFEFDAGKKVVVIPGWLFQTMAKARETNFGVTVGYHIIEDPAKRATLFLGLWHRWKDSMIPKLGFEWKGFRAGFAYDLGISELAKDSKAAGGRTPMAFEISLSYIGQMFVPKEDNYLFNPRY